MANQNIDKFTAHKNGILQLAQGHWSEANKWFDTAIQRDSRFASAYLGKLLCELEINTLTKNRSYTYPLVTDRSSYISALRYADASTKTALQTYAKNQKQYLDYEDAVEKGKHARSVSDITDVAERFRNLGDYKDSKQKAALFGKKIEKAVEREHVRSDYLEILRWTGLIILGVVVGILTANMLLPENRSPSINLFEHIIYVFAFVFMFAKLRKQKIQCIVRLFLVFLFCRVLVFYLLDLPFLADGLHLNDSNDYRYFMICTVAALFIAWATAGTGYSRLSSNVGYPILFTSIFQLGIWIIFAFLNWRLSGVMEGNDYDFIWIKGNAHEFAWMVPSFITMIVVFIFLMKTVREICDSIYGEMRKRVFGGVLRTVFVATVVVGTMYSLLAVFGSQ